MSTERPSLYYVASTPSLMGLLLFGPFVLGLLIYIYAFCSQGQKRRAFGQSLLMSIKQKESQLRGAQTTHVCLFTLLIFDAFTVFFGVAMGITGILSSQCAKQELDCIVVVNMWLAFRWISWSQHLITALVSILFLYHPKSGSVFRIVGKVLNVPTLILLMVAFRVDEGALMGFHVYMLLLTLAIVVSCLLNASSTLARQRKYFALLAVFMYVSVCLPNSVLHFLMFQSHEYLPLSVDVAYITNFYFILDALLFYFVFKIKDEEQPEYEGAIRSG